MCLTFKPQSFQTVRLEGLLDSLYKDPESLPEQEVTWNISGNFFTAAQFF